MSSAGRQSTHIFVRARNYLLLVLLGAIGFLVFLKIAFAVEDNWGHDAFIRWDGLVGFTLVLFTFFVGESQKFFRRRRFWMLTAVLMAVHLAAFAIVLTHVEEWKLMWFMVMILEYPLLVFARNRLPDPSQDGEE